MTRLFPTYFSTLALLTLAACAAAPADDLYVLRANEPPMAASHCNARGALVIARPYASQEYDTQRIAVLTDAAHLTYYTGASWASPLPEQLRDFMRDYFMHTGQFRIVARDNEDTPQTMTLSLIVQEADVVNAQAPVVHLRMTALIRSQAHQTLRSIPVDETVTPAQNHTPEIVAAFTLAAQHAAEKIAAAMPRGCK